MFILRDLLSPLQAVFYNTAQGAETESLVCIHTAGCGGAIYIINHL